MKVKVVELAECTFADGLTKWAEDGKKLLKRIGGKIILKMYAMDI